MRRKDREIVDRAKIYRIVDSAKILHMGLADGDYPYIVPLHYGFEYLDESDSYVFYMHGAKSGHKLDLIEKSANAFIELETDVELLSGGDDPCEYSSFYASFMGRGQASVVQNEFEKEKALKLLMKNQTARDFEFTQQMIASAAVIKVVVKDYTAKAKSGTL